MFLNHIFLELLLFIQITLCQKTRILPMGSVIPTDHSDLPTPPKDWGSRETTSDPKNEWTPQTGFMPLDVDKPIYQSERPELGSVADENIKLMANNGTKEFPGEYEEPLETGLSSKLNRYYAENVELVQRDVNKHWPLGIIHYYLDATSYDYILGQRLRSAMDMIESVSCVQFHPHVVKPAGAAHSWLHITNPRLERKCVHKPEFKPHGEIMLVLGLDCLKRRDILHTLLHAIGCQDEVTHPQRDQYVRVIWKNIQPEYSDLFKISTGDRTSKPLVEYDPMSIMHFHDRAFSINGQATIVPLIPGMQISPSDKLSQLDKMKLRLFFGHECNRRKVDDLLDTCKNVLHENNKDSQDHGGNIENNYKIQPKNPETYQSGVNEKSFEGPQRRVLNETTKSSANTTVKGLYVNPKFYQVRDKQKYLSDKENPNQKKQETWKAEKLEENKEKKKDLGIWKEKKQETKQTKENKQEKEVKFKENKQKEDKVDAKNIKEKGMEGSTNKPEKKKQIGRVTTMKALDLDWSVEPLDEVKSQNGLSNKLKQKIGIDFLLD